MATKRMIVEQLTADELRAVVDRFAIEVGDRRARGGMIEAAAASRKVDLEPVLSDLPRERLKELCRKLGLDDGETVLKQPELLAADWSDEQEHTMRRSQ